MVRGDELARRPVPACFGFDAGRRGIQAGIAGAKALEGGSLGPYVLAPARRARLQHREGGGQGGAPEEAGHNQQFSTVHNPTEKPGALRAPGLSSFYYFYSYILCVRSEE